MKVLASAFALALILVAGCSSGPAVAPPVQAVALAAVPQAMPTPLATERQIVASSEPSAAPEPTPKATIKPKPTATPKPKPKATPKPTSYYRPAGWDGSSDVNCADFDTHAQAQSFFKGTGGSTSNDPYGLDRDHDGLACETLP
jgi:hypothetical protein